ncbi:hypothetical protein EV182_000292 [Spiromyces aspiralis]|uniref:Uncharacterized protein n=1 Tax=Spiromyces aspiralis TaxID=68401 RepID=A0ACC1HJI9_9FUNG|nr:hypothetical protein EV182_000292 [Spiromyces aspiralis]
MFVVAVAAVQIPLLEDRDIAMGPMQSNDAVPTVSAAKKTIIDVLAREPELTKLVGTLQRLKMILPLNSLENVTFFAPTNQAFKEYERNLGLKRGDRENVGTRGWSWHWPWWGGKDGDDNGDGSGKHRGGSDDSGQPEDPLPQSGAEYHGITDTQMWYHLVIDGILMRDDFEREMVLETGSLWRPPVAETNETAEDPGRPGVFVRLEKQPLRSPRLGDGVAKVVRSDLSFTGGVVHIIDRVLTLPPPIYEYLALDKICGSGSSSNDNNNSSSSSSSRARRESDDPEHRSSFESFLKLIELAGWKDNITDGVAALSIDIDPRLPDTGLDIDTSTTLTVFGADEDAFGRQFNSIERAYLLRGLANAGDHREMAEQVLNDVRLVAGQHIVNGSVSIGRLGGSGRYSVTALNGREMSINIQQRPLNKRFVTINSDIAITCIDNLAVNGTLNLLLMLPTITTLARETGWQAVNFGALSSADNYMTAHQTPVGVVHQIEKALVPRGLKMTPYKYLVGVNATKFVRLFEQIGLLHYLDGSDPDRAQTLLVPTNRAMDQAFPEEDDMVVGEKGGDGVGERGEESGALALAVDARKQWALYHVVDGQHTPDELKEGRYMLLRSKLAPASLKYHSQVIKVSYDDGRAAQANPSRQQAQRQQSHGRIVFNGEAASVLPEPISIGNTTIYLLSGPMSPPPSVITSLISDLSQAMFVATMGASGTDAEINSQRGITVLVPGNDDFADLGLLWSYLTIPNDREAHDDLARIVRSHVLKRLVYSDSFDRHETEDDGETMSLTIETLNEDTKVKLTKLTSDGSVQARVVDAGSPVSVELRDQLLQSGVAHRLQHGVLIPPNVRVTSRKLLRGMHADSFVDLLDKFGLTSVLDGDENEEAKKKTSSESGSKVTGYSLLVPSDKAWWEQPAYREYVRREHEEFVTTPSPHLALNDDKDNPWRNRSQEALEAHLNQTIRLHIVPIFSRDGDDSSGNGNSPQMFQFEDRREYPTLLDGVSLLAHEYAEGKFALQLSDPTVLYPNSPFRLPPYMFLATIIRGSNSETGGVYELDVVLPVPDMSSNPRGWRSVLWLGLVWTAGLVISVGLISAIVYWVVQLRRQEGYEQL